MNKVFRIDVYTPTGKYLSKDADFLKVTSSLSVLGIMPNHAPLITTLEICKMTIRNGGKEDNYAITGGVMHIKKDHNVVLMLDAIESVEEIDLDRALDAKRRAEERLQDQEEVDVTRAKAALARALNRISVKNE